MKTGTATRHKGAMPAALPMMRRAMTIEKGTVDREARTVELTFSSEYPVPTYYGMEILGHGAGEVDLSRIVGAPLLVNHNVGEQVGVVESAKIADGKGRAVVRFGRSPRAEEIMNDVDDGIRPNTSVGYVINRAEVTLDDDGDVDEYRATLWAPYEITIATIPADPTVGVGRSADAGASYPVNLTVNKRGATVDTTTTNQPDPAAAGARSALLAATALTQPAQRTEAEILSAERKRSEQIAAIGEKFNCRDLANKHIGNGTSAELFSGIVLDSLGERGQQIAIESSKLGLTGREIQNYSVMRAMRAMAFGQQEGKFREAAKFEMECSAAVAERSGRAARGFFMPVDIQTAPVDLEASRRGAALVGRRTLTVGTAAAGGNTVATDLDSASFIELLRARMMLRMMGARVLSGLVGNLAIPKQTGAASLSWVAENGAPGGSSDQAVGQVPLSPKTATAFTDYTRQLLLQSSLDIENFVRDDLAIVMALGIDLAGLHGPGTGNQPTGIAAQAGVAIEVGGTNGAAPTYANMVNMESDVAVANADVGTLGYLSNPKVRGKLKQTAELGSTFPQWVWDAKAGQQVFGAGWGMVNGYRAGVTTQVSSTLTKGTAAGIASAIFFGNFADVIIGEWGELDILVNPFTNASSGAIRTHVFQSVDIALRHAESFAVMLDALTT